MNKIQIPRCGLLGKNIAKASGKLQFLNQRVVEAKQLVDTYQKKKEMNIIRRKEISEKTYSKEMLLSVGEIIRATKRLDKLKDDCNIAIRTKSSKPLARRNTMVIESQSSADELFNKVDR